MLTLGEALVAALPADPVSLQDANSLRLAVGGAEVNVAVSLARLGIDVGWVGRLGDDPFGHRVRQHLNSEGVNTTWAKRSDRPTGVYFREWLTDGARRVYYYRSNSAGRDLNATDWPDDVGRVDWVHVSGITSALGDGPAALLNHAVDWALERDIPVSFDPNYRPALWSPSQARSELMPLVAKSSVLLASEDDAELLFDTADEDDAIDQAMAAGASCVVIKLGSRGAIAHDGDGLVRVPATFVDEPVDPVGAGDGFDAGFIAGKVSSASLTDCLLLGALCGASVVKEPTDHGSALRRSELPARLAQLLSGRTG